jgi:hypothetical protein
MRGFGMLEQMTGLPIGMKTMKCEYAPKPPTFAAAKFLNVALSFYKNNCVGCPHRSRASWSGPRRHRQRLTPSQRA